MKKEQKPIDGSMAKFLSDIKKHETDKVIQKLRDKSTISAIRYRRIVI